MIVVKTFGRANKIIIIIIIIICRMAHTRGGVTPPVAPPRVYTTLFGVKVRKVHGGYVFQPPSLKVSSYLALDRFNSESWSTTKSTV